MTRRVRSVSTAYRETLKRALSQAASELQRKFAADGPPYDPYLVARAMQVDVQETELAGIEGYIEVRNGRFVAFVSKSAQERRRRFTLGHELCHVLLTRMAQDGERVNLVRFRTNGNLPGLHQDPVEESLCNYFAGELLMPADEIRARLSQQVIHPTTILELADDYQVSMQAAAIQLARGLGSRIVSCSFWNLESLWPVPVWWTGFKTEQPPDLRRLEQLADRRDDLVETWQCYGGRREPVKIMVTPTPAMRYAMIVVVKN